MSKNKKKNIWAIIPSRDADDQLYNRRLITYFGLAYSAIWFQEILIVIIIALVLKSPIDAAVVAALLGVPATLAGLGFWRYLEACKKEDRKNEKTNEEVPPVVSDSEGPTDPEV